MTVIATDGRSMAADGIAVSRGTIVDHDLKKVVRLNDGTLIGSAGIRHEGLAFKRWIEEGGGAPKIKQSFEALVLRPDGSCTYHCEKDLDGVPTELPAAIGSGMDFALGAMDAGASPFDAVRHAANRCPGIGGTITTLDLLTPQAHLEAA